MSERPTRELGHCLVTGGSGLLGRHLVAELLRRGLPVRVLDRQDHVDRDSNVEFVAGDVRNAEVVRKACEGVDTVFHGIAVMDFDRFPSATQREVSHGVNVTGTRNVIAACEHAGVARLVYTSSNNVTFGGPIEGGDETWPYVAKPRDLYTETKILGEQAVLAANSSNAGGTLLTCAVRPGGIYGPGDGLIFPRFVEQLARGRFVVTLGDPEAKSDNTYVENLVDGAIEAARHLVPGSAVCGQAYFVTDDHPINYFEFFRPYAEALGQAFPKRNLPAWPMLGLTWILELLGKPSELLPLNHLEVRKIVVPHYSHIDKARRDFGWTPPVSVEEATRRCLPYVRSLWERVETVDRPHGFWWVSIPFGMGLLAVLAFSPTAHELWSTRVTGWTPRWFLQPLFVWAALLHAYKGMKAVRIAERAGFTQTSMAWGWQTLLLGFASMRLLERRAAEPRTEER